MSSTVASLTDYRLQDAYYQTARDEPEMRRHLAKMVDWERSHPPKYEGHGWTWQDVNTAVATVNRLIAADLVDRVYASRTSSAYRLRSLAAAREALAEEEKPADLPAPNPKAMFGLIVGHEETKAGLRYCLSADGAVHALLIGPPGTAKTLMLTEISRLAGAVMYVGSTTSKSGLVSMLIYEQPRYLVIDELDKMSEVDASPLLNLMQNGFVSRLQHGQNIQLTLPTTVFAGANEESKIKPALLSRFAKFYVPAYTERQFVDVAALVLERVHGQAASMAKLIASELVVYSTDIRDAERVCKAAHGNPLVVRDIIRCFFANAPRRVR